MKKRGLIVSTIVMVVVLAIAVTTATYAWFSSTADAEVKNINVSTVAAEGLQIAVNAGSGTYVAGEIDYTSGAWSGSVAGFGSFVDFANITTESDNSISKWSSAVTKSTATVGGLDETFAAGTFIKPNGYDDSIQPTGFDAAGMNVDYLYLPIAITPTAQMYAIICTITVLPDAGDMGAAFLPGMAAAARIEIANDTTSKVVEPFSSYSRAAAGMFTGGSTKYAVNEVWTYSFVVAYASDLPTLAIQVGEIYNLTYTIWIEGTDNECHNITAGSGFNVDIAYNYEVDATASTVNANDITITGSNAGTYNILTGITTVVA